MSHQYQTTTGYNFVGQTMEQQQESRRDSGYIGSRESSFASTPSTGISRGHEDTEMEVDQCDISSMNLNGGSGATRSRATSRFNHHNGFGASGFSRSYEDLRPTGSGSDGLVVTASLVIGSPKPTKRRGASACREMPLGQSTVSVSQEVLNGEDKETVSRSLLLPPQSGVNAVGSWQSGSSYGNQNNQNIAGTITIGPAQERKEKPAAKPHCPQDPQQKPSRPTYGGEMGYGCPIRPAKPDPPKPKEFQIFVRNIDGKTFTFEVKLEDTVQSLMQQIKSRIGIPLEQQVLNYAGKTLEAKRTLAHYKVIPECTMYLTGRLRGG